MTFPDALLHRPQIRLAGPVNDAMLEKFLVQFHAALGSPGPIVLELTTAGGEADIGRRIAQDIRIQIERAGANLLFFGKTSVFSAGVTIMSGFPRDRRYLSSDTHLLIHERHLKKEVQLDGALRSVEGVIRDLLAQVIDGQALERDGFEALVEGTGVHIDTLYQHVLQQNWYLTANEALKMGLIADVI